MIPFCQSLTLRTGQLFTLPCLFGLFVSCLLFCCFSFFSLVFSTGIVTAIWTVCWSCVSSTFAARLLRRWTTTAFSPIVLETTVKTRERRGSSFSQLGLEPNHTGLTAQSLFFLEESCRVKRSDTQTFSNFSNYFKRVLKLQKRSSSFSK